MNPTSKYKVKANLKLFFLNEGCSFLSRSYTSVYLCAHFFLISLILIMDLMFKHGLKCQEWQQSHAPDWVGTQLIFWVVSGSKWPHQYNMSLLTSRLFCLQCFTVGLGGDMSSIFIYIDDSLPHNLERRSTFMKTSVKIHNVSMCRCCKRSVLPIYNWVNLYICLLRIVLSVHTDF